MNFEILSRIGSPHDLKRLDDAQLEQLAAEIRQALISVATTRPAHFASNLGVVELCLALHLEFDFSRDRLIWDTGHQIYPHKLITGRFHEFPTIRQQGGLMGYPNPLESDYDLFMTGHAGASVSTVLGLKTGDDLLGETDRRAVAVIGDGALPSGIVFEAMNNAAGLKKDLLVILNDNKMGICPRVGGLAEYLDKARVAPFYNGLKRDVSRFLHHVPVVGDAVGQALANVKDAVKGLLHGGMLFEELGFRYIGPVDGHDLKALRRYLRMVRDVKGPVLLHVFTEKGRGFGPAVEDPVRFHTPSPFICTENGEVIPRDTGRKAPPYTQLVADAIYRHMQADPKITVLTAAMCAGNKLDRIRADFPDRFFDTGICEGHAVAFAAGMAKAGVRPIVDIYSTFLQRSFDQIFQEVALQNLPVVFCMDRAGLTGPDGPTHHGVFDNTYMRTFPNIVVTAPGDALDVEPLLDFALRHDAPVSIRYPKATAETVERAVAPVELGRAEVIREGRSGAIVVFGALLPEAVRAAEGLVREGIELTVVNARFCRPLDFELIGRLIRELPFVITVEESTLMGGFGSAVLEAANAAGLRTEHIRRLGIPDRFIEHGERQDLLRDLGLDADGIAETCRQLSRRFSSHAASAATVPLRDDSAVSSCGDTRERA
ncbi:MAG: 1-deoxy-D-xylulose-5-phosphate synthase [Planctomycetota bacterium]|nr:MAG: 1-deoxy-D-xylulose-5-phosphate synthase [Planctomycetota bacterium]